MAGITRRDFMNGLAIGVAGTALAGGGAHAGFSGWTDRYPPRLTGLRGAHVGSYEVAHAMSWEKAKFGRAKELVDETYDLVVVGGGLSGLAAARYFQKQHGPSSRILILDNHDDFGGHAKRNEFDVDGRRLIGHGGSQSIDTPSSYSAEATGLLSDLGVEPEKFYSYFDRGHFLDRDMTMKIFFDAAHYGQNKLVNCPPELFGASSLIFGNLAGSVKSIKEMPFAPEVKRQLKSFLTSNKKVWKKTSDQEKYRRLESMSYLDYLRTVHHLSDELITLIDRNMAPLEALAWETVPASWAAELSMPGTSGLRFEGWRAISMLLKAKRRMPRAAWQALADRTLAAAGIEPYIFHFPDGNASLARLLVRKLMPHVAKGATQEDSVLSSFAYHALDWPDKPVRIRLESTVVDVRHNGDGDRVDVSYKRRGEFERVEARNVVLACTHKIIPYICEEFPPDQRAAMDEAERAPLAYVNVALRNWRAFEKAKTSYLYSPRAMFPHIAMDFPVSMGGVEFSSTPDDPVLLHIPYTPAAHLKNTKGRSARDLFREGKHWLYVMSFEDFEVGIKGQLDAALGSYGFEAERDIAAITVNRWPHGYAYTPSAFWGDKEKSDDRSPQKLASKPKGRIAIANSDAEYKAYVNGAFDAAWRAVKDLS